MSLIGTPGLCIPGGKAAAGGGGGGGSVYPIQGLSDVLAAYGFHKLTPGYTGNAFRALRTSDNAQEDIGFLASGALDVPTLLAFVGSSTGCVAKWYDQSGNGNDLSQGLYAPVIVNAGAEAVNAQNGHPVMDFPSGQSLTAEFNFADTPFVATIAVQKTAGQYGSIISQKLSSSALGYGINPSGYLDLFQDGVSDTPSTLQPGSNFSVVSAVGASAFTAAGNYSITPWLNSVSAAAISQNYGGSPLTGSSRVFAVGAAASGNGTADTLTGVIGELVILNQADAIGQAQVEAAMRTWFGVAHG